MNNNDNILEAATTNEARHGKMRGRSKVKAARMDLPSQIYPKSGPINSRTTLPRGKREEVQEGMITYLVSDKQGRICETDFCCVQA